MDLQKAKENRENFLTPYRKKFEKAKTEKTKAKIISELIEIEPSHLSEPWIIKEVVAWLRDRNCIDFIDDAFIKAPKKYTRTDDQRRREVRDMILMDEIHKIMQEKKISERAACEALTVKISMSDERYYLLWDTENGNQDLEESILNAYKKAKANQVKTFPPWPYYGRDIEVDKNGKITIFGGR